MSVKLTVFALALAMTASAEEGTARISCDKGELTIIAPYAVRQITISYADVLRACTNGHSA